MNHFMRMLAGSALVFSLAWLTGCSSSKQPYTTAAATGERISGIKATLVEVKTLSNDMVGAMDDLMKNPRSDLTPQFEAFAEKVDALDKIAQQTRDNATNMRARRDEYLEKWKSEVAAMSPDMQQRANARMGEVKASFEKLATKGTELKDVFGPFLADAKDLRQYLAADLTSRGVTSSGDLADKVRFQKPAVEKKIDELIVELDRVSAEIAPAGAAK